MGAESSRTVPDTINNLPSDRITGGATRGVNLFHSFGEFNINAGRGAYFENPSGIANIFTRVTGGNPSNILGNLGVLGNSNLFLINPKGIVFGPQARLDLGGSFVGSSASGVVFNNGFEFSSANPQTVPLLAINIPVGLRFIDTPGAIVNASSVTQVIQDQTIPVGLAVPPGQTLALVGGDVIFNNGFASAFSGNIQLGSVVSPGVVSFNITPIGLGLDYTNVANFGNIELSGLSAVTASGPGGGAIAVRSGNVTLRDRSSLVSDTIGSIDGRGIKIEAARFSLLDRAFVGSTTSGSGAGGPIEIRTAENIELKGIGFEDFRRRVLEPGAAQKPPESPTFRESGITTGTLGAGRAGELALDTKRLTIREGSAILNPTLGTGDGGNVTIRASESVEINGSALLTTTFFSGNAGSIAIETSQLSVTDGAVVSPSTLGAGNSGNLIVRASDSVIVARARSDSPLTTALATNSVGTGRGGNIEINTRSLRVEAGASISSSSGVNTKERVIPEGGPAETSPSTPQTRWKSSAAEQAKFLPSVRSLQERLGVAKAGM